MRALSGELLLLFPSADVKVMLNLCNIIGLALMIGMLLPRILYIHGPFRLNLSEVGFWLPTFTIGYCAFDDQELFVHEVKRMLLNCQG